MIKNRGFTDKLYFLNLILSWLFIIACIILQVYSINHDGATLDIAAYGIPAVFAELSIHTGFVVWKAKHENYSKYGGRHERYFDDSTEGDSVDSDDPDNGIFDTSYEEETRFY